MQPADQRILDRFTELLALGEKVLATRTPPSNVIESCSVDARLANQWMVSSIGLIQRVLGPDSPHAKRFAKLMVRSSRWSAASQAFGVLRAAEDDVKSGALFEVRKLVEAELFDDFLDQAEHLLKAGYYQPAVVVAGCVLEDGLRKLCTRQGITLSAKPKLDSMNATLAKSGLYTKLTQKRITAMADLRNSAAHGKWSDFDKKEATTMIRDTRDFMEKYFT